MNTFTRSRVSKFYHRWVSLHFLPNTEELQASREQTVEGGIIFEYVSTGVLPMLQWVGPTPIHVWTALAGLCGSSNKEKGTKLGSCAWGNTEGDRRRVDTAIFKHTYKYEILRNDKTFLTGGLLWSNDHPMLKHYYSKVSQPHSCCKDRRRALLQTKPADQCRFTSSFTNCLLLWPSSLNIIPAAVFTISMET